MKLSGSTVIQIGPCREVFPLPSGDGTVHFHAVGPRAAYIALLSSQKADVGEEHLVMQATTLHLPRGNAKYVSARAVPPDAPNTHTKLVISIEATN